MKDKPAKRYTWKQFAAHAANARWSKLNAEERAAAVPRNGGRKRRYPQCPRYKAHRFTEHRCPCGYVRPADGLPDPNLYRIVPPEPPLIR